jgi:hypothetical protein
MSTGGTPMDMDMSYGGYFAPAQFTNDNAAGSGPTTGLAISNLRTVHMNDAARWKEDIHAMFDTYETTWLDRMVKPVETLDRTTQLDEILKKLSHPMFNPSASWIARDITSPVHHDRIESEIASTIGISPPVFCSTIQSLHVMYQSTVATMFELDGLIQGKLKKVEELNQQLFSLTTLSDLSATSTLRTSISQYTEQLLEASNIHEEYPRFIHTVGVFQSLRSLLKKGAAFQEKELKNPCTICMNEEIDSVLIPCGHPFCSTCAKKTRTICFLCRTPVLQKQRVYF